MRLTRYLHSFLFCPTFFDAARFLVLRPNGQVLLSPPADGGRGVAVRPALEVGRLPLLQLEVCRRLRDVGRHHHVEVRRLQTARRMKERCYVNAQQEIVKVLKSGE